MDPLRHKSKFQWMKKVVCKRDVNLSVDDIFAPSDCSEVEVDLQSNITSPSISKSDKIEAPLVTGQTVTNQSSSGTTNAPLLPEEDLTSFSPPSTNDSVDTKSCRCKKSARVGSQLHDQFMGKNTPVSTPKRRYPRWDRKPVIRY